MARPPRDSQGIVKPYDDPNIADDDGLFRYINPEHHLVDDHNIGAKRLSSAALSETRNDAAPYGGMSVDIESLIDASGINPVSRVPDQDWGIIRLISGDMRKHSFMVGRDPLDDNPQHGEVWGIQRGLRKTSVKKDIMSKVEWVKKATGVP